MLSQPNTFRRAARSAQRAPPPRRPLPLGPSPFSLRNSCLRSSGACPEPDEILRGACPEPEEILRGACPEPDEILRFAQDDKGRRVPESVPIRSASGSECLRACVPKCLRALPFPSSHTARKLPRRWRATHCRRSNKCRITKRTHPQFLEVTLYTPASRAAGPASKCSRGRNACPVSPSARAAPPSGRRPATV